MKRMTVLFRWAGLLVISQKKDNKDKDADYEIHRAAIVRVSWYG